MARRTDGHISWRDLVDRRDGLLSGARGASASAHLASGCAACEAEAVAVERLVAAIADGAPERPPRAAEERAIRAFRDVMSAFSAGADRVLGVLLLDGADEIEPALRSADGGPRRLLWRVGTYELDADVVRTAAGADLLGQFVPGGDDPSARVAGFVTVRGAGGARAPARVAPDGRFTVRGLVPGVYAIEGCVDETRFALPPVRVD